MATLTRLKKTQFIPFIDISDGAAATGAEWARVAKSTIFALNPNPQTETLDFISYETPITEIEYYQPELPLECYLYEGDSAYDFMINFFYSLPTGTDAVIPTLICFGGTDALAWYIEESTVTLGELNTVDGKLSFTLNFGGDITKGTYTITDGTPAFTEA